MSQSLSRREFVLQSAVYGSALWVMLTMPRPRAVRAAEESTRREVFREPGIGHVRPEYRERRHERRLSGGKFGAIFRETIERGPRCVEIRRCPLERPCGHGARGGDVFDDGRARVEISLVSLGALVARRLSFQSAQLLGAHPPKNIQRKEA